MNIIRELYIEAKIAERLEASSSTSFKSLVGEEPASVRAGKLRQRLIDEGVDVDKLDEELTL